MDARFLSLLRVERAAGSDSCVLTSELAFSSAVLDRLMIVPIGFEIDFASVPRLPLVRAGMGGGGWNLG